MQAELCVRLTSALWSAPLDRASDYRYAPCPQRLPCHTVCPRESSQHARSFLLSLSLMLLAARSDNPHRCPCGENGGEGNGVVFTLY